MSLLMLLGLTMMGQTEKGKYFVSGGNRFDLYLGGQHTKTGGTVSESSKYSYTQIYFQDKFGYTFIKNMPVGLYVDVEYYKDKAKESKYMTKDITFSIGPFIRYYFADLVGLKPYVEGMAGFGLYRQGDKSSSDSKWTMYDKEGYFTYKLGGGATFFFNDYMGLDLFLGFNHECYSQDVSEEVRASSDKTKYIYNEFTMQLGVVVMLKGKQN